MGIIDPMVIGNATATGVLEFSAWPVLWLLTASLLSVTLATVALAGTFAARAARPVLPTVRQAHLAIAGMGRAR
jgi:hypothetical protein